MKLERWEIYINITALKTGNIAIEIMPIQMTYIEQMGLSREPTLRPILLRVSMKNSINILRPDRWILVKLMNSCVLLQTPLIICWTNVQHNETSYSFAPSVQRSLCVPDRRQHSWCKWPCFSTGHSLITETFLRVAVCRHMSMGQNFSQSLYSAFVSLFGFVVLKARFFFFYTVVLHWEVIYAVVVSLEFRFKLFYRIQQMAGLELDLFQGTRRPYELAPLLASPLFC